MNRLLLVEDEEIILKSLRRLLERNHYEVHCATTVDEALDNELHGFDLILADLRLPGKMGTALIPAAAPVPVIIMTSHASVRSAVDAMRAGAIDYIAKPFDHDELLMVITRSLQQTLIQSQNRAYKLSGERLYSTSQHVAGTELETILDVITKDNTPPRFLHLQGECGIDRESLAKAIHLGGSQPDGPFLVLDLSIDTRDAETLFFGTQAASEQPLPLDNTVPHGGYLAAAHNGTLVIRYPEHLPEHVQLAISRALTTDRLAEHSQRKDRNLNVNLISISACSIETLQEQSGLCEAFAELFIDKQFEIPPLRMRLHDIAVLANRHLKRLERRYNKPRLKLSDSAMAALMANHWRGNVAELESMLSRAAFLCRTSTIHLADLGAAPGGRDLSLDEYFRYYVLRNQATLSETELASRLGISRKALWERRQKMNLIRDSQSDFS